MPVSGGIYIQLITLSTLIFDGLLDRMGGVQEVGVHEGAGVLLGRGQLQDLHRQREAGGGQVQPDGRARAQPTPLPLTLQVARLLLGQ